MYQKYIKRLLDIILSLLAIIIILPIFLIIGIFVLIFIGRPALFRQKRPGKNEKIFTMYKFRTMTNKKDKDGNLLPDELRLTKLGKILRKTSLDEIPEFINILKGDMSFVGPRPLLVEYLPYYTEEEHHRHDVRPGLTGLAQVSGRNLLNWDDRFKKDIEYINNITLKNDLIIILKTFIKVIKRENVVIGKNELMQNLDIERSKDIIYKKVTLKDIEDNNNSILILIKDILKFNTNIDNGKSQEVLDNMQKYINDGTACITGAFFKGKIIGFLWMYEIDFQKMHINYFCVDKNYRSKGIGTKLLMLSIMLAKEKKIKYIELRVEENNDIAKQFYARNNFKKVKDKLLLEVR